MRKTGGWDERREPTGLAGLLPDCGAAASPALPAGEPTGGALPPGRGAPPLRTSDDRAGRAPGRVVLHGPGSLSPRKITVKGAPKDASLAPQGQTLDCDLLRKTSAPNRRTGGVCGSLLGW